MCHGCCYCCHPILFLISCSSWRSANEVGTSSTLTRVCKLLRIISVTLQHFEAFKWVNCLVDICIPWTIPQRLWHTFWSCWCSNCLYDLFVMLVWVTAFHHFNVNLKIRPILNVTPPQIFNVEFLRESKSNCLELWTIPLFSWWLHGVYPTIDCVNGSTNSHVIVRGIC